MDRQTHIIIDKREIPRLPLEGNIDLTYRCNCNCRHCWQRLPANDPVGEGELSLDEIGRIIREARALGCQRWSISGGEPMLRPDFVELFDLITHASLPYTLNTNGTLITPAVAALLKRKGTNMVALYGATAEIHDHITRTPGSFEAAMQGFAYLREAKAGFIVQLVPMRDNYHQFDAMVQLARSLSPAYRIGAPWLYLSARRSGVRNREISRQRLDPAQMTRLDTPDVMDDDERTGAAQRDETAPAHPRSGNGKGLFSACIDACRDFHIDPYGGMTFCPFITDPALRYDLRGGHLREGWDHFIPSLANQVRGEEDDTDDCDRCEKRGDCRWCPAYGYLEHGQYSAKVAYLCALADETRAYRTHWRHHHRRYFRIAGVTIRVDSDLPFTDQTLDPKFRKFEANGPSEEMISLRHHFSLPQFNRDDIGQEVYRRPPWAIYRKDRSWIYLGIRGRRDNCIHSAAVFNEGHTRGRIYNPNEALFRQGNLHALTMFPSDQILLARALADRQACFIHAAGLAIGGKGFLLVGHSGAGKTTAARLLREQGEILCDDRIIVRRHPEGLRIHGSWSHGDLSDVSPGSAPLSAILFLEKADENRLIPVTRGIATARLLAQHVVKPLVTADWWKKILELIAHAAQEVPAYRLRFDKTDRMADTIVKIP
ncbi:MAG: radical SAM protein [Thermodesulfobacteriota bacterium]